MASKNKIYVAIAYRWGDNDNHSYPVAVGKKDFCIKAADAETEERGGKYAVWVYEAEPGVYDAETLKGWKIVYKTESSLGNCIHQQMGDIYKAD